MLQLLRVDIGLHSGLRKLVHNTVLTIAVEIVIGREHQRWQNE